MCMNMYCIQYHVLLFTGEPGSDSPCDRCTDCVERNHRRHHRDCAGGDPPLCARPLHLEVYVPALVLLHEQIR